MLPLTLSLLVAAPAAPVPKSAKPTYYAATKVGDKMEFRDADGKETHSSVVMKVEEAKGGGLLVTEGMSSRGGPPKPHRVLLVTEDAVAIKEGLAFRHKAYDPPQVIFKLKGKWEWEITLQSGLKYTERYAVERTERVEVPTGTFEAIRVQRSDSAGYGLTVWYAPGVGEVKRVEDNGPGKGQVRVLHRFTPGKD
jgi:hypothetical protein